MLGACRRVAFVCVAGAGLAACASGSGLAPPSPGAGEYKVGQPYEVGGQWYTPREQPDYDEEGIASWYGPSFYGHRTADGEIFNAEDMTAAHPTLPMPVYVRVTNLDNGRQAVLRVNDRGPYANNRIIDVSEHAAEVLGFKRAGTAHVRVQYLGRADHAAPPPAEDDSGATVMASSAPDESSDGTDVPGTAADAAEAARTAALNAASAGTELAARTAPVVVAPAITAPLSPASGNDETEQGTPESDNAPPPDMPSGEAGVGAPVAVASLPPDPALDAPVPAPLPASEPASAKPGPVAAASTPARTHLYVQAGAFSSRENANRLVSLLASIGSFFISPVEKAGTELYRVRSGPFDDLAAATAALARVTGLGNNAARIVVDQ